MARSPSTRSQFAAEPGEQFQEQMAKNSPGMEEAWNAFMNEDEYTERHANQACVLYRDSPLRSLWSAVIAMLLVYTATIFMYRLCFVELRITVSGLPPEPESGWALFDQIVAILFWIDLFANFFFSVEGPGGRDIDTLSGIAKAYLKSHFIINFLACIPASWVQMITEQFVADGSGDFNQGLRAFRLQRVSRLAKLVRLTRLGKLRAYKDNPTYIWLTQSKGVRIVNLSAGLFLVMHMFACGWYLCATLHDDPEYTWVNRRFVDAADEKPLLESSPFDQWLHSMYFILTVFSTVGFGDMSAFTVGEIMYVCALMVVGAVVHSIIISQVINVVQSNNSSNAFVEQKIALVDAFAIHTELDKETHSEFKGWLENSARAWETNQYDKEKMKELITGKYLPRELLGMLPESLFDGKLVNNRLFSGCKILNAVPPRLPTLLAICCQQHDCKQFELIYKVTDFPFNLFMVLSGTFAYVAYPSPGGGLPATETSMEAAASKKKLDKAKSRSGTGTEKSEANTSGSVSSLLRGKAQDHELVEINDVDAGLFPYQLFSCGSYFGDLELFQNCPRHTTSRCESKAGQLLSLRKKDLEMLTDEFPPFGVLGRIAAMNSGTFRQVKQKCLTEGLNYKDLAAKTIQGAARLRATRNRARATDGSTAAPASVGAVLQEEMHIDSMRKVRVKKKRHRDVHEEVQDLQDVVDAINSKIEHVLTRFVSVDV